MIQDYSDPIVTLNQVYKATSVGTNPVLGACIIGPNYIVKTYEDLGKSLQLDSDLNYPVLFGGNQFSPLSGLAARPYPGLLTYDGGIDVASVKVLVKNAIVEYREFDSSDTFSVLDFDTLSIALTIVVGLLTTSLTVVFYGTYADKDEVPFAIGDNVIVTFTDGTDCKAFIKGFLKDANAKYTKCVLDKKLPEATISNVVFCKTMDTYISDSDVIRTADTIAIGASAATEAVDLGIGATEYNILEGAFYALYKVLSKRFIGKEGMVASPDDVEAVLGKVCALNPLGLAVACAAAESGTNFVFFTAVDQAALLGADDVTVASAYAEAAEVFADKDGRYGIVPCIGDKKVLDSLFAFVQSQSSLEIPYYKYLYAALLIPLSVSLVLGLTLVESGAITYTDGYTAVKFAGAPLLDVSNVVKGDLLVFGESKLIIVKTNYKDTVYLQGDCSALLLGATEFGIEHKFNSNDLIVDYLIQAKGISDKRCSYVFADGARYKGIAVPNYCVAAALAGLRANSAPHAPLSNVPVASLTTDLTRLFTASQSKRLGAYGFWRVGQNEDGVVISRRQLTSAASGDPNYDEQSIVCDVDHICLFLKTVGRRLVGNSNITGALLDLLLAELRARLTAFTRTLNTYIGPQLLSYTFDSVLQDPIHKDRVYASFSGEPPKPFNRFHMTFYMN